MSEILHPSPSRPTLTLRELAAEIGAEVVGDPDLLVHSTHTLEEAGPGQVSFLANPKYLKLLGTTRASAVIVAPGVADPLTGVALLRTKDPYFAFTKAVVRLHGHRIHPHAGIHPLAHVDPSASVGEGTIVYPFVFVGPRARIGRDCILYPNVTVYDDCVLGDRVIVHAGCTIGHDGFGYATHKSPGEEVPRHHKTPQIGNVVVGDDVEFGANCAVQRAALGSTVIGRGTKFSDLIAMGHGAKIGPHGLLVAQVGIAGSTTIGHHVTMGGQSGTAGHLTIGDNVTAGGRAGIVRDVPDQSTVLGMPAMPISRTRRVWTIYSQLPELLERIKRLEQQVEELGAGNGDTGNAGQR